jgi:hypothetical protein
MVKLEDVIEKLFKSPTLDEILACTVYKQDAEQDVGQISVNSSDGYSPTIYIPKLKIKRGDSNKQLTGIYNRIKIDYKDASDQRL